MIANAVILGLAVYLCGSLMMLTDELNGGLTKIGDLNAAKVSKFLAFHWWSPVPMARLASAFQVAGVVLVITIDVVMDHSALIPAFLVPWAGMLVVGLPFLMGVMAAKAVEWRQRRQGS